jgi:pimeloyl-ACP methyl ester carboxylesterase
VDAPARVASLVIVNSGPDWTPKTPLQRLALRSRGLVTGLLGPGAMARVIAPRLFPRPDQAGLRRDYVARMGRNDTHAYAALLDAIMGWSVADQLASLTMPTLVVASEGDYTSVASKEAWTRLLPDGRLLVVPGARHALPLEAPEAFNALLEDFFEEVQPPDGR